MLFESALDDIGLPAFVFVLIDCIQSTAVLKYVMMK